MLARVALAVLLLSSAPARAEDRPLEEAITVARSGECLEQAALVEHVRTWLSRERLDARLAIVVDDDEPGAAFVVTRDGEAVAVRRFERLPRECADRRAALGLAIAMALDAAVLEALDARAPEPPREAANEPEPPAREPEPRSIALALELVLEAQALFEVLPEVAAAWQVGARLVIEESVEIAAHGWLTSIAGADLSAGRVAAQLAGARLDVCARRAVGSALVLRGCLGGASGAAFGTGRALPGARSTEVGFAGLLGRVGVSVALAEWLALEVAIDGWLDLWRPRFDVVDRNGAPVASAELPLGGVIGALGLSARF